MWNSHSIIFKSLNKQSHRQNYDIINTRFFFSFFKKKKMNKAENAKSKPFLRLSSDIVTEGQVCHVSPSWGYGCRETVLGAYVSFVTSVRRHNTTRCPLDGYSIYLIWGFFENLSRKLKFHYSLTRITDTLYEDLCIVMIFFLWCCNPTRVMVSSFLGFSRSHTTTHHSR